jgi:hypothetical protein
MASAHTIDRFDGLMQAKLPGRQTRTIPPIFRRMSKRFGR